MLLVSEGLLHLMLMSNFKAGTWRKYMIDIAEGKLIEVELHVIHGQTQLIIEQIHDWYYREKVNRSLVDWYNIDINPNIVWVHMCLVAKSIRAAEQMPKVA